VLEGIILDALRSRLMQPDLVAEFAEAYQQEVNRQRAGADIARERAAREMAQVERKLAGLVEAIANGLRAPSLQQTLDDLERRRAELTTQLAAAPAPLPRLHPNLAEVYRRKVSELGAALRDPPHGAEALTILRGLTDKVTLTPAKDHFDIELEGALVRILALANSGNNGPGGASVSEVFRSSVKVVAGARNQRFLRLAERRIPKLAA
jgi:site-specific DNA recombinase